LGVTRCALPLRPDGAANRRDELEAEPGRLAVTSTTIQTDRSGEDAISNVLKWVLLLVAIGTFAGLAWATVETYAAAPPQPDRYITADGALVMRGDDIIAGKSGFQRADLMDYGSLYGMGSYFGEDYTATNLVALATLTQGNVATARFSQPYAALRPEQQWLARTQMQAELQGVDLSAKQALVPPELASAIVALRGQIAAQLQHDDFAKGWTHAASLDPATAVQTADFLIFSSLTTVARRPGTHTSWTQNWPFEPMVGNTPSTSTFLWTWGSIGFTFLALGVVLFIYERYLNDPDNAPMDPVLATFRTLTPSQRKTGKYFLVVAAVFLLQILVGAIMAHYYSERANFYGWQVDKYLRDVHTQTPIVWIGLSWIAAALFLAPAISGQEAKWQGLLVDVLFYVTLAVVVGALVGDYFGVMGYIGKGWFWFGNQGLSYIQMGRAWQIGFFSGLIIWSLLVFRAMWPTGPKLAEATRQFWTGNIRLENLL
jgi:nitric oxide reductase subunit B